MVLGSSPAWSPSSGSLLTREPASLSLSPSAAHPACALSNGQIKSLKKKKLHPVGRSIF